DYFEAESVYGISKHAMNDLTNYIRLEYSRDNISAVSICPGLVRTAMGEGLQPKHQDTLLEPATVAAWVRFAIEQPEQVRFRSPLVLGTSRNPWSGELQP